MSTDVCVCVCSVCMCAYVYVCCVGQRKISSCSPLYFDFFRLFYYRCVCLSVYLCTMCMQVPEEARKECWALVTADAGSCEPFDMGAGKQTQVLCKSSNH